MDEKYSTIRLSSLKCHVFDHESQKILCGLDRWRYTPFKINKRRSDLKTMYEKHKAFATRRGDPNPYKFTCIKCEDLLEKILDQQL